MKLFLKIIFLITVISSSARADEIEDVLCNKSASCKKFCKMQKDSTYDDLKPEAQEVMVKCVNDIVAEINAAQPVKN
jgi:predicted nucleic acid-binding OB-fold protein